MTRAGRSSVVLAICAMLVILCAPRGWMPGRTANGFGLVLCSGAASSPDHARGHQARGGAEEQAGAHAGHHGGHGPEAPPEKPHQPCAFALLGSAPPLTPPALPVFAAPPLTAEAPCTAAHLCESRALAAPPPPSHAPPLIV